MRPQQMYFQFLIKKYEFFISFASYEREERQLELYAMHRILRPHDENLAFLFLSRSSTD